MQAATTPTAHFQQALDTCINGWNNNHTLMMLPGNFQVLFGDAAMKYFKHTLVQAVGGPVTISFMDGSNGPMSFVQMPENDQAPLAFDTMPVEPSSKKPSLKQTAMVNALKKTPRPMNCWIIFRDAMHKKIKAEHPNLRVQEISTRCSEIWQNLTPEEKEPWQEAAKAAKEEHNRLYPDYKYSPRRPGEIKKRESRKSKVSARVLAAAVAEQVAQRNYSENEAIRQHQLHVEFASRYDDNTARQIFGPDMAEYRRLARENAALEAMNQGLF